MKGLERYWSVLDKSAPRVLFKAKKFLARFCLENDGFSVEAFVQEDFIWCKCSEALVTKDQTIVNISDVSNEQMMIGENLVEGTGPNLFTDGNDHKAESW